MAPMTGMMMSATSDDTIAPNATPMMTPTARSTTLPRSANFLKSSSIAPLLSAFTERAIDTASYCLAGSVRRRQDTLRSVDQARVDHRVAHRRLGLIAERDQRQADGFGAASHHRQ